MDKSKARPLARGVRGGGQPGRRLLGRHHHDIPRAPLGRSSPGRLAHNPGLTCRAGFPKDARLLLPGPAPVAEPGEQDQLLRAGLVQRWARAPRLSPTGLPRFSELNMISAIYDPTAPTGDVRLSETGATRLLDNGAPAPLTPAGRICCAEPALRRGAPDGPPVSACTNSKVDQHHAEPSLSPRRSAGRWEVFRSLYVTFSSELDGRSFLGQPPNRQPCWSSNGASACRTRKPRTPRKSEAGDTFPPREASQASGGP